MKSKVQSLMSNVLAPVASFRLFDFLTFDLSDQRERVCL